MDFLEESVKKSHEEISSAMDALIEETRQACSDCGISLEDWDGNPRREFRDDLK